MQNSNAMWSLMVWLVQRISFLLAKASFIYLLQHLWGFLLLAVYIHLIFFSTLVSPYDILKRSKHWRNGFSSQYMKSYFGDDCDPNFGWCTLTCHSNIRCLQNITINGVVMNKSYYTHPLIFPEVSIKDPENKGEFNSKVTLLNCLDYALIYDNKFTKVAKQKPYMLLLSTVKLPWQPLSKN